MGAKCIAGFWILGSSLPCPEQTPKAETLKGLKNHQTFLLTYEKEDNSATNYTSVKCIKSHKVTRVWPSVVRKLLLPAEKEAGEALWYKHLLRCSSPRSKRHSDG